MKNTQELIAELRKPKNDFPSYFEGLCARAAQEIERLSVREELNSEIQEMIIAERMKLPK